jgi:hypothetical protein
MNGLSVPLISNKLQVVVALSRQRSAQQPTDWESVETCCFAGLFGNSVCELCARFSRNNRVCPGQYPIRSTASLIYADGVVKPLSDTSLCFHTWVVLRADNTSRLIEEYVRMFLRRYSSRVPATKAGEIVADRPSIGLENANPASAPSTSTSVQADSHRKVHQIG